MLDLPEQLGPLRTMQAAATDQGSRKSTSHHRACAIALGLFNGRRRHAELIGAPWLSLNTDEREPRAQRVGASCQAPRGAAHVPVRYPRRRPLPDRAPGIWLRTANAPTWIRTRGLLLRRLERR